MDEIEFAKIDDGYEFPHPQRGLILRITRLQERREDLYAEIWLWNAITRHWLSAGRLNLLSHSAVTELARQMKAMDGSTSWLEWLTTRIAVVVHDVRQPKPLVFLQTLEPENAPTYLVDPLLPWKVPTILYADGSSGKSLLALALAAAVRTQVPLPGLTVQQPGDVLYLDWETTPEVQARRLRDLTRGLDLPSVPPIAYRCMTRGLPAELEGIQAQLAQLAQPRLLIIDSLAPACGGDPETADSILRFFEALRVLNLTTLVLAHVSKADADLPSGTRPFGSVFSWNLARSVWQLYPKPREGGDADLVLALFHRKSNDTPLAAPIGLRFCFSPTAIALVAQELDEELARPSSLTRRILVTLRRGAQSAAELAMLLEASEASIERLLRRLRQQGKVARLEDGRWGLVADDLWTPEDQSSS